MQPQRTPQTRSQIADVVYAAIDELNEQRAASDHLAKAGDTRLVGERGGLDSLAFVNLIVILEQRLEAAMQVSVNLLDDERLDPSAGRFDTLQDLIDHVDALMPREDHV